MSKNLTLFLLLICTSWHLSAQDIYVTPGGDDANDGTQSNPVATIKQALSLAASGSTIFVMGDGTNNVYSYVESPPLSINTPVTITGLGEAVRVTTDQNATDMFVISSSDVTVEGLILDGLNTGTNESVANIIRINLSNVSLSNISITQNQLINGTANGLSIESGLGNVNVNSLLVSNNFINNNDNGISLTGPVSNSQITENDLSGNSSFALENTSGTTVMAMFNWWGGFLSSQVVAEVSNLLNTVYSPWLANGSDADPSADGFQTNFSGLAAQKTNNNADALTDAYNALANAGTINLFSPVSGVNNSYESVVADKSVQVLNFGTNRISLNGITTTNNASLTLVGDFKTNSIDLQSGELVLSSPLVLTDTDAGYSETGGSYQGAIVNEPVTLPAGDAFSFLGASISSGPEPLTGLTLARINNTTVTFGNSRSIEVVWDINVNQETFSPRTLTFTWDKSLDGINNFENGSEAFVWKSENDGQSWDFYTTAQAEVPGIDLRVLRVNDVTSFSQWTISDVNNPLPVELTSFTASLLESHVQLNWETASEENADFFAVERSEDGKEYKQVGTLKAAGNSDAPLQYRYIDEQAAKRFSGSLFYRLRTVDFDGSYEYSDIISIVLSDDGAPLISAFVQEGRENMKLFTRSIEPGTYHMWITDLSGRKIYEQDVELDNNREHRINIGTLPRSVYMIRCVGKQIVLATKFKVE